MAEGVATARTLFEVLGVPVFFGIDAGNLTHALKTIIQYYKIDTRITKISIAADYDENGIGEKKAAQALLDNGVCVSDSTLIIPRINVSTDWNDVLTNFCDGKDSIIKRFKNKEHKTW